MTTHLSTSSCQMHYADQVTFLCPQTKKKLKAHVVITYSNSDIVTVRVANSGRCRHIQLQWLTSWTPSNTQESSLWT